MVHSSRRQYLHATAAIGIVGTAGCIGNGNGEDDEYDRPRVESGEEDEYGEVPSLEWYGVTREDAPLRFQAQNSIQDTWEEVIGIDTQMEPTELGTLIDLKNEGEGDLVTMWWFGSPERLEPTPLLRIPLHSEGANNAHHYSNPKLDEAIETLETEPDFEERQEACYEAQRIAAEDQPFFWPFHLNALGAYNQNTFDNWNPQPGGFMFWNTSTLSQIEALENNDSVVWGTTQSPTTLNPLAGSTELNNFVRAMYYDRLVRIDTSGEFVPSAATDISVEDQTTIDVTLRDGMVFHDGEPVTAEDVQFTLDYIMEHEHAERLAYYEPIDNVEIIDDDVVRFNLLEPTAAFPTLHLARFDILPKHIWEDVVEEEGLEHPDQWTDPDLTGSGPFQVVEHQDDELVSFERFEDYYMDFDFESLVWDIYGSLPAVMGDLEGGDVTFAQQLEPTNYESAEEHEEVAAVGGPSHGITQINYQSKDQPPFSDVVFRHALAHTIDQQSLINVSALGLADVAHSPVAPANEPFYNEDAPIYDGGPEEAIELLSDAGYRWDDDGNILYPISRFEGSGPPELAEDLDTT